jgi:DNA-directed RNA polymerase subunit RPC12/RpoP
MAKIVGMDGKGGGQPPQQQQITLDKTKPIVCKKCGGDVFFPGAKFRSVSRLLTGQAKDSIIPVEVYTCGDCGTILDELLPAELRNEKDGGTKII